MLITHDRTRSRLAVAPEESSPLLDSRPVSTLSDAELVAELGDLLSLSAKVLLRAATVWGEARHRGLAVPLRSAFMSRVLPLIAGGILAAEAAAAFADAQSLLTNVGKLPPEEQRRLAAGDTIPVVLAVGEAPIEMTAREVHDRRLRHVFVGGSVLTPELQTRQLLARESRPQPARRGAAAAPASPPARPAAAPVNRSATEDELQRLALRVEAELRARRNPRPTPALIAEIVGICGWLPAHSDTTP